VAVCGVGGGKGEGRGETLWQRQTRWEGQERDVMRRTVLGGWWGDTAAWMPSGSKGVPTAPAVPLASSPWPAAAVRRVGCAGLPCLLQRRRVARSPQRTHIPHTS
jgi:hypothetical protein